jgi:hypothetical protein
VARRSPCRLAQDEPCDGPRRRRRGSGGPRPRTSTSSGGDDNAQALTCPAGELGGSERRGDQAERHDVPHLHVQTSAARRAHGLLVALLAVSLAWHACVRTFGSTRQVRARPTDRRYLEAVRAYRVNPCTTGDQVILGINETLFR